MTIYSDQIFTGERALFQASDLQIHHSIFEDGESPLKHSQNLLVQDSEFRWKYPLWYSRNITVQNCRLTDTARAGIWYSHNIDLRHTHIDAPKTFRRCSCLVLSDVALPSASETLWDCSDVTLKNVQVTGDYFGMNCDGIFVDQLEIIGNYCFDGAKNATIYNSRLISKDAFWNAENITISDSYISGEYFGWNSKNMTLINCTVESLQGFCFIENLVMKHCTLLNTTLAFEYSSVDAEIISHIDSIKNPSSGIIKAKSIGELILDPQQTELSNIQVISEE